MREDILLNITADDGRSIRLTKKQWSHISYRHPEMSGRLRYIEEAIAYPTHKKQFSNETIKYYLYLKDEDKYIMAAVRVLNGDGFVMTAYLTRKP